jgi:hypothetical protein
MASPTTRTEFRDYCLRRLGHPVIEINVDEDQVEDRIDDALKLFYEQHHNGTEKVYYKYQVTADDITNRYITLPQTVQGVVRIFNVSSAIASGGMFGLQYQLALNDIYQLTGESLIPYATTLMRISEIRALLVGVQPIRYNRHTNILYLDLDWSKLEVGMWLIVELYQNVEATTYADVWGERWLQKYATALIKRQWGANLIKYSGVQLMGGVVYNGEKIYNDAVAEIEEIESEAMDLSVPCEYMIG